MEGLAILPFLILILFGGLGSSGAEVDDTQEADDNGPEPQGDNDEAPTITPIIFDDTNDPDNGLLTGTDAAELFIGSLEANGTEGFNTDVTNPNDTITALGGNDTVIGGIGNDQIDGGAGNDLLSGGLDNDTVVGGLGDDTIAGNEGTNVLTGGDGDDVFIIVDDEDGDTIEDFSNAEGNRDFIDLTAHFDVLEEARAAYNPETGVMQITSETITFDKGITDNFTPETTGLPLNIAPVAVADTVTISDQNYLDFVNIGEEEVPRLQIDVITGQGESAAGADNDVDGDNALLRVNKINTVPFPPEVESPGYSVDGVQSITLAEDGRSLSIEFTTDTLNALANGNGVNVGFNYTIVDRWGGESETANVQVNFVAPEGWPPVNVD